MFEEVCPDCPHKVSDTDAMKARGLMNFHRRTKHGTNQGSLPYAGGSPSRHRRGKGGSGVVDAVGDFFEEVVEAIFGR